MQQRQLRLGDILDDYCPRERRVTNHAVVAMIGEDVKQTRCTTCDADHEYKHAKIPRQRRKTETPAALYSQVLANGPKRVAHEGAPTNGAGHAKSAEADTPQADVEATMADSPVDDVVEDDVPQVSQHADSNPPASSNGHSANNDDDFAADEDEEGDVNGNRADEGPVHRPLIRASLPRTEGQQPPARPIPEFTIRQPAGRQNRFRPRGPRAAGQSFQGNRGNGNMGGGPPRGVRSSGGRPPQGAMPSRVQRRHGPPGRKRSK